MQFLSVAMSPNIIRQIKSRGLRGAGHLTRMGEERNVYKILVGKPNGKRPLGRSRRRWDQNGSYGDWLGGGLWIGLDWLRTGTGG
jgi:hypothetical protein